VRREKLLEGPEAQPPSCTPTGLDRVRAVVSAGSEKVNLRGRLALLVVLTAGAVSQAQDEFKPITVTHVQGSVYLLDGAVDEIGASVGNDGVLLVDGGYMETFTGCARADSRVRKGHAQVPN
jgi:hypothetical protein